MDDSSDTGTASTFPLHLQIPGYRLRYQTGADSLGLWFSAEQTSLGRKVSLKVLRPQFETHEAARREFLAEMDRLAALDHPNLPRVLDTIREGTLVLVLERIGSRSVEELLAAANPLGEKESLHLAQGVARALQYLTSQGLSHKNVTPRLIIARDDGNCRLVTFRNIITLDELKALRGRLAQDPHYVAPEQLTGKEPIGEKTHAYQVGALLFHFLARRPPHEGATPQEIAKAHLKEDFPSLKRFRPFLPDGIYAVIEACTQRAPDPRPDLRQLAEALEALQQGKDPGLPPVAKKHGIVAPRPRRRRRRR